MKYLYAGLEQSQGHDELPGQDTNHCEEKMKQELQLSADPSSNQPRESLFATLLADHKDSSWMVSQVKLGAWKKTRVSLHSKTSHEWLG